MIEKGLDSVELGFDIVIVGAGTAGCVLAANLSEEFKVLLVDSKGFPRRKACSGVLVSEGMDFFGGKLDEKILMKPLELDIEYVDWNNNLRKFSKKGFLNCDRFELDKHLFEKLKSKSNVVFIQNTRLIEFADAEDKVHKVILFESDGTVKPIITKYLVGCDGAISLIRRKIFSKKIPFYVGVQELIKTEKELDKAYFIFDNELTDFYGWVIPKKPFVDIGILLSPQDSREKFELFRAKAMNAFGIQGKGVLSSAVVLRPSSLNDICLGRDKILLCGEAAGLISPSSAEGISYALRSAKFCADAFNSENSNILEEYKKNCKSILDRLEEKFKKSRTLSNKNKRKAIFG